MLLKEYRLGPGHVRFETTQKQDVWHSFCNLLGRGFDIRQFLAPAVGKNGWLHKNPFFVPILSKIGVFDKKIAA